jgi:hypothetical protein
MLHAPEGVLGIIREFVADMLAESELHRGVLRALYIP